MKYLTILMVALVTLAVGASLVLTASAEPEVVDTITLGDDIPYNVAVNPQTNLVYVTAKDVDGGSGAYYVAVIDSATNTVTATIPIENGTPLYVKGIAVNPDTNTVYVATAGSGIAVIDGATNAVTAYIPLPQSLYDVAVNRATNTVYAVDWTRKLWVISGATNTVTGSVPFDGKPFGVAVNPDTNTIYVTQVLRLPEDPEGFYVWVIDGATNSVTTKIPIPCGSMGVAADPGTNTIYVSCPCYPSGPSGVWVIDGATNSITEPRIPTHARPRHLALDTAANRLYVAGSEIDKLSFIDTSTNTLTGTIAVSDEPWGVDVSPITRRVYVVNLQSEDVTVIEDDGLPGPNAPPPSRTPAPTPTPVGSPAETVGIDVDPSGNTATSLGTIDRCIEVSSGQTVDIDVFVDAIPEDRDLKGFSYLLNYDASKLQVNACNHDMLLASEPGSHVEDFGDEPCHTGSPPDTDGTLLVAVADLAAAPEPGGSLGVLGRYQLEAVGSGITVLTISPTGGGILADSSPAYIPVNEIHDGNWTPVHGIVAIDEPCPGPEWTPTPTPSPTPTPTPTPTPAPSPTPTPTPGPPPTSTIDTLGIDVDPSGNTATSLGAIDRCIDLSVGQTFDIDVFVDDIPEDRDLEGFNYVLNYDASKLQVNACNHEMLLASEPDSLLIEFSDEPCKTGSPPDTDGMLLAAVGDFAAAPEPGGSLGVLGRYQLQAVGSGTSVLTLSPIGGFVVDSWPSFIPVDEVHDGNWTPVHGIIAVDSDIDGDGVSDCADPDTDGDGFPNAREDERGSSPLDAGSTPEECDGLDNDGDALVDEGWPDADSDGIADCLDPDMDTDGDGIANPDDPDDDNDGFSDEKEIFMGLSSLAACGPEAWAPDMNDDATINVLDMMRYRGPIRGEYDRRYDLNTDGSVNVLDLMVYRSVWRMSCTNP